MVFLLIKKALKNGGDKYSCETDESFVIYVPQSISRIDGEPKKSLNIDIT